jgi:thiamine biosynthesis protein ThiI
MDKEEIVREARQIGTYEISIIPDEDCCTLFTPKHPATKARERQVEAAEQALGVEPLVDEAVASAVRREFTFPVAAGKPTPADVDE